MATGWYKDVNGQMRHVERLASGGYRITNPDGTVTFLRDVVAV